jgi:transcriptional regulator with XRE-family HTH domain
VPSLNPEEPLLTGAAICRAVQRIHMPQRELAARLKVSQGHISAVFLERKPVTPTFQLRVMQIIRLARLGALPEIKTKPKQDKPAVGYCGSGANLPEDYEPAAAKHWTDAPSGSEDKIAEMQRRAERGEELFHPRDNQTAKRIGD